MVHGALLDSQILAEVYLELVGGKQPDFTLNITDVEHGNSSNPGKAKRIRERAENLKPRLTKDEENRHRKLIKQLGDHSMWSEILKL